jgi:hypothetical protein
VIDDDLAHGARGHPIEVAPALPVRVAGPHELQVRLVDEGRSGERSAAGFAQLVVGPATQVLVDNPEQPIERRAVSLVEGAQQSSDLVIVAHGRPPRPGSATSRDYREGPAGDAPSDEES